LSVTVKRQWADASAERCAPPSIPTVGAPYNDPPAPKAACVQARIFGCKHLCLLDSGADVSLIPAYCVPTKQSIAPSTNRLYDANETEILLKGQVTTTISIQRHQFCSTFLVTENVDDVILGRDWLSVHKAIWDFNNNAVVIGGHRIELSHKERTAPRCKRCRVSSDVDIPPLSEAVIPVNTIFGNFQAKNLNEQ